MMFGYYDQAAERANDVPNLDRPADVVIADLVKQRDDLSDLVNSLRTENAQLNRDNRELTRSIRELEREGVYQQPVLYAPGEGGHRPARTGKSVW